MFTYSNIPIILALLFLIVSSIILLLAIKAKRSKDNVSKDFIQQLNYISNNTVTTNDDSVGLGPIDKWNSFFGKRLIQAGMFDGKKYDKSQVGAIILLICVILYALTTLYFKNFGIGIMMIGVLLVLIQIIASHKLEKKMQIFQDQIPAFLSILKSNIQSGDTAEIAFSNAVDETNSPLHDELIIAKYRIQTDSMSEAMRELRRNTDDPSIKFLSSCMEIASSTGSDLSGPIETIEVMFENRAALRRKLQSAVAENTPLIYISMILLPVLFIFTYTINDTAKEFWFVVPISWIVFFVAMGLFVGGLLFVYKIIKKVGEF